jgi:hypothetical protein
MLVLVSKAFSMYSASTPYHVPRTHHGIVSAENEALDDQICNRGYRGQS